MITANQIRPLREAASDDEETRLIKTLLANRRLSEGTLYLNKEDFDRIARWKLGQQLGRVKRHLEKNTQRLIRNTTRLALDSEFNDEDSACKTRLNILMSLPGVGIGLASAILALAFPERYCVIDFRGWYQLFRQHRTAFSPADYVRYLRKVRILAEELGWTPQQVDVAIWEFDKRSRTKRKRRNAA
jgi:hypothetical protein